MVKERLMIKEKKFFKRGVALSRETGSNLRLKIIILSVVFLIFIILYQTYFESNTYEKSHKNNGIFIVSDSTSINILNNISNINNVTPLLHNPTIAMDRKNQYLMAFEEIEVNGSSTIRLSTSKNGISWSPSWSYSYNVTNAKNPLLEYVQDKYFILTFEHEGKKYISTSKNGSEWSIPQLEEIFEKNDSIYYTKHYLLKANKTGLWFYNYKDLEHDELNDSIQQLLNTTFLNASILKIHNYKYL